MDSENQQRLIVAVASEGAGSGWFVVHDITHSKFVSNHTRIGGYGGGNVISASEVLNYHSNSDDKIVLINNMTDIYR
jgi:hypothetical protein